MTSGGQDGSFKEGEKFGYIFSKSYGTMRHRGLAEPFDPSSDLPPECNRMSP